MKYYYMKRYRGIFFYSKRGHREYGFRLTYYDKLDKRHEKKRTGFDTLQQAVTGKRKIIRHQQALSNSKDMTVDLWCKYIISERKSGRPTTYKSYAHLLEDDVIPYIGRYKLVDLTPMIYQKYCWDKLVKRGLSENTIKDVNAKLQTAMNEAVDNKLIKTNPIRHPRMSRIIQNNARPRKQIMNQIQLKKFNKCLFSHPILLQTIYFTLERTGMRAGELLGLHWKDLDLERHTLAIKYTRDAYGERQPKTRHSRRKLTIDKTLNNILKQYYRYSQKHYHVTGDSHVILGKQGRPLIPKLISIELKQLLSEAGLKSMIGKFTPHSFRHQFASDMIVDYHIDPLYVSRMLGHASPSVTMKIYAQLSANKSLNIGKILNQK